MPILFLDRHTVHAQLLNLLPNFVVIPSLRLIVIVVMKLLMVMEKIPIEGY